VTQSAIPCILEAIKSTRCATREAEEGKASKSCLSWYASMPAERCSWRTPQTWQCEMWRAKETHVQLKKEIEPAGHRLAHARKFVVDRCVERKCALQPNDDQLRPSSDDPTVQIHKRSPCLPPRFHRCSISIAAHVDHAFDLQQTTIQDEVLRCI
jgi:hypothetical protein